MTAQAEPIRSLDACYYTDPAMFETERTKLFARSWQFAGHVSQLEEPGDYFTFEMFGESLFCIKGRDGVVRTFYNVCQHRAHQLVSGAGSTRVVVCPYHAWTYELTGRPPRRPRTSKSGSGIRPLESICLTASPGPKPSSASSSSTSTRTRSRWTTGSRARARNSRSWVPQWEALKPLEWVEIRRELQLEGLGRELLRVLPLRA